jgi:hypothetical protein
MLGYARWGKKYAAVGLLGLIVTLATNPTRGALVYILVFFLFTAYNLARNKRKMLSVSLAIFFSVAALYVSIGGLPQISFSKNGYGSLSLQLGINEEKKGDRTALEEIEWRFGAASRMSIGFLHMYNRGDDAGINPIKHSFLGFLPRSLNPEKPIPSSVDPYDIYSQGMYLIYREAYGYNTFSMVEFSTGGHAYWEFGWLGVLILPFIAGVYIGLCAHYFSFFGAAGSAIILIVFKPFGYMDPKIWVSDIAMQIYQVIVPIFFLVLMWSFFRK